MAGWQQHNSAAIVPWNLHQQGRSEVELQAWILPAVDHSSQHTAGVDEPSACTGNINRKHLTLSAPSGDYGSGVIKNYCMNCMPNSCYIYTHTHTHTHLRALCPGLPRWAGTRKVKPIWILLYQETVNGSGISWAMYKSTPCSRQIMPALHHSVFTGRMPFLSYKALKAHLQIY